MRILYGAFAQGHGHFSKAAVLVPLLEARGCEVFVISSGWERPPQGYAFVRHRHFPGLSYAVVNGRPDASGTFRKWLRDAPRMVRHLWRLRRIVREYQPELIVSDFEPLTASPLLQPPCEVVALSRQVALFDRQVPLPETKSFDHRLTRSTIRLFTAGADRLLGYHYEPASFRCVPPIIRPELRRQQPCRGDHLFVYNHYDTSGSGSPERLVDWARRRNVPVRAYGFAGVPRGRQGGVDFRPASRDAMLDDLRTARAALTSAGLTTPLEAFLLRKPVVAVPLPNQWEQAVNAFHLDRAGLATACDRWDYDLALQLDVPDDRHPLMHWLTTPPERIVDRILSTVGRRVEPDVESVPQPAQPAAA